MVNHGRYNITYNAAMLAKQHQGIVIALDLPQVYPEMTFVPLEPALELSSVDAWRSGYDQGHLVATFVAFLREQLW